MEYLPTDLKQKMSKLFDQIYSRRPFNKPLDSKFSYFEEDDEDPSSNQPLYQPGPDSPTAQGK